MTSTKLRTPDNLQCPNWTWG